MKIPHYCGNYRDAISLAHIKPNLRGIYDDFIGTLPTDLARAPRKELQWQLALSTSPDHQYIRQMSGTQVMNQNMPPVPIVYQRGTARLDTASLEGTARHVEQFFDFVESLRNIVVSSTPELFVHLREIEKNPLASTTEYMPFVEFAAKKRETHWIHLENCNAVADRVVRFKCIQNEECWFMYLSLFREKKQR